MLRFGFVLLITALPLLGMEAMSTTGNHQAGVRFRSRSPQRLSKLAAQGRTVLALIPAAAPVSTQARPVQTDIRSCEADLDHALVLGRRYKCGRRTTTKRCGRCTARSIAPFLTCCQMAQLANKALACLEQLPRHQRQSLLESPARRVSLGVSIGLAALILRL